MCLDIGTQKKPRTLKERIEIAQQGIKAIGLAGVNRAMGDYNGR